MSKEAYVTLVATDSYGAGALVLAHRLQDLGSQKDLVCLVTKNISRSVLDHLSQLYQIIPVETLYSDDHDNLELLGRPDLDITFTKIQVWKLTRYKKIVFLDADTLPLKNVDELFERPHFSAASDAGWPDCFNSGVFVTTPSETDYQALKKMAMEDGSFDGGDQGLLNKYFSSWSTSSSEHRLPFTYNMTPTSQYTYAPSHQYYGNNIAICHFIGLNKPWKYQRYSDGSVFSHQWKGYTDLLQSWWDTWNLHYGQSEPEYLLSKSPNDIVISSYNHQPIQNFRHFIENAWDNINIHSYMEDSHGHRHIVPMPPIDKITITHSNWSAHNYDETSQCSSHHIDEDHSEYFESEKNDVFTATDTVQNDHCHNDHENKDDPHNNYQMINWNPACESPPNQGISANIPDLSVYDNAWDKPVNYSSIWIAPDPQPIPKFDYNYDFVHERYQCEHNHQREHNDHEYNHQREHNDHEHNHQHEHNEHEQHLQHQQDENYQPEHNEQHHSYQHEHHQHEHHQHEHHQHFIFPWEYRQEPVPTPTRIWLDELVRTSSQHAIEVATAEEYIYDEKLNNEQEQQIENSYNDNYGHQHEINKQDYFNSNNNYLNDRLSESMHQSATENINESQNNNQYSNISEEITFSAQSNDATANDYVDDYDDDYNDNNIEIDEAASDSLVYAMDTISYESIIKFLKRSRKSNNHDTNSNIKDTHSLNDSDEEDDDDRQLIPIPFKATSKLGSGGLTPTPVQSPIGSRRNSISRSRRSSISSQKSQPSNILSPITTKPSMVYTDNINNNSNDNNFYQQPHSKSASTQTKFQFSKKTPYTSAATTPTKEYASFIYTTNELTNSTINTDLNKGIITSKEIFTVTDKSELENVQKIDDNQFLEEEYNEIIDVIKKETREEDVKPENAIEDGINKDDRNEDYINDDDENESEYEGDDYYNQYSIDESLKNSYIQYNQESQQRKNSNEWNPELALELLRAQSNHIITSYEYRNTVEELNTAKNNDNQDDSSISENKKNNDISSNSDRDDMNNNNNNEDYKITNQKQYSLDSIVISSSKKKEKDNWDDNNYLSYKSINDDIQSAGTTSPTTPIIRSSLKNNLMAEIEAAKEQHRQQRASLALVQPKTAIATVLEAELDLTKSGLFNRRSRNSIFNSSNSDIFNSLVNISKNTDVISEYDLTPNNDSINDKSNTNVLNSNENNDTNYFASKLNTFEPATTSTQTTGYNVQTWRDDVNNTFKQMKLEIKKINSEQDDDDDDEEEEEEYTAYFDSSVINAAKNKIKELVSECTTSISSSSSSSLYDSSSLPIIKNQTNSEVNNGESSQSNINTSLKNLSRYTFSETLYGLPSQQYHPYITMKNIRSGPPSPSNVSTLSLGSIASNNHSKIPSQASSSDHNSVHPDDNTDDNNLTRQPPSSFIFSSINDDYYQSDNIKIENVLDNPVVENEQIILQPSSIQSPSSESHDQGLNKIIQPSVENLPLEPSSIMEMKDICHKDNDTLIPQSSYETTIVTTINTNTNVTTIPTTATQSLSIMEKRSSSDLYSDAQNISTWLSLTTTDDQDLSSTVNELTDEINKKIKKDDNNNNDDGNSDDDNNGDYKNKGHTHIFDEPIINDINDEDKDKKKSKLLELAQSSPLLIPTVSISIRKDLQRVINTDHERRSSLSTASSISSIPSLPPATTSVTDDGETIYLSALEDNSDITSVDWRSATSATPIIDDLNDDDNNDNSIIHASISDNNDDSFDFNSIEHDMIHIISTTTVTTTINTDTTITTTTAITENTTTHESDEYSSLESDHTIT